MSQLQARRAANEDAEILAQLLTAALQIKHKHNDTAWGDEVFTVMETTELIKAAEVYLFYEDGALVGAASIQWEDDMWKEHEAPAGYIHRLAAASSGTGIGSKILTWAEDYMKERGKKLSRLDCSDDNKSLCQYYEKRGYKCVETIPAKNQDEDDSALYEKVL